MAKVDVVDLNGKKVGSFELADEVFGVINEDLLWEAVQHFRAAKRAGTHATKNKKLVSGSGKKLWKQKGTGRARVGSIRSPLWRHGGTVHGPQPRSYDFAFPKKKDMRKALDALGADKTSLLVANLNPENREHSRNLYLSSRNLDGVELVSGSEVHPYHLLRYDRAIFSRPAIDQLQETLKKTISKRQKAEVA
jgi:large subunit ribosomal protein L4